MTGHAAPRAIPQDAQARRVRLLSTLERRLTRMNGAIERLARLRAGLRPLMTRLRAGDDPGVVEAEVRRLGWRR